jgi:beta-galactosidase
VAPILHLPAAVHRALRDHVRGGGRLVLTAGSGLTDEHCRVTPGALDDLVGARRIGSGLHDVTAAVLHRRPDGRPALTENRYGAGTVLCAADADPAQALGATAKLMPGADASGVQRSV